MANVADVAGQGRRGKCRSKGRISLPARRSGYPGRHTRQGCRPCQCANGFGRAAGGDSGAAVRSLHFTPAGIWVLLRISTLGCGSAINYGFPRTEEHTSELQSLMCTSYPVFFLTKKTHEK